MRAYASRLRAPPPPGCGRQSYMTRELDENLSGNEVDHTASSLLVILKNSCSKFHYQKGFDLIPLSCKIGMDMGSFLRISERNAPPHWGCNPV